MTQTNYYRNLNIFELINFLNNNHIGKLKIHRDFIWNKNQIISYWNSYFNDIPLTSLILWKVEFDNNVFESLNDNNKSFYCILDGFHRINNLFYILDNDYLFIDINNSINFNKKNNSVKDIFQKKHSTNYLDKILESKLFNIVILENIDLEKAIEIYLNKNTLFSPLNITDIIKAKAFPNNQKDIEKKLHEVVKTFDKDEVSAYEKAYIFTKILKNEINKSNLEEIGNEEFNKNFESILNSIAAFASKKIIK